MRKEFSNIVEKVINENSSSVFITGDLGYNALENVQKAAQGRFVNAGVAEQNMIGVAAGIAYNGFEVFTYSIAPFTVYRCLEQIKLDVCLHDKPVYIVGNGGGYGYGIMGATHHAIEDIACLSGLPNMTCWIPAFTEDVEYCIKNIRSAKKPAYLRLGLGKNYPSEIKISAINKIIAANNPKVTIVALGPIVHNALMAIADRSDVEVFTVIKIPIIELSNELLQSINTSMNVLVIEEHIERGGLGEHLLMQLAKNSIQVSSYSSLNAKGYPSGTYGSQSFHQEESGLDVEGLRKEVEKLLEQY